ncbi:hypothetical protein [Pseudolactococcus raffinolactis]|uniref:hypothetical protein n=1 Tax=Pseudolactococcus raffinolactis TaxID=1366 RepID=UPI001C7097C2|nr:hypothetical protein [Lactococcus raffinolactis]
MVMRNKSDSAYKKEIEKMSVTELTDRLRPFFLREVENNYELKSRVTLEEEQIDWISHFICTDLFGPF